MQTGRPAIRELMLCIFLAAGATGISQQNLPELEQARLAAEHGDPVAQHKFGEFYLSHGNCSTAFEWYQKAAKQGNIDSQYRLGEMLMDGRPKTVNSRAPVAKNTDESLTWLLLAANQGQQLAQLELGRCYESGKGVNQDIAEAYKWYKLVEKKGFKDLNQLVLGMSHDQIQEGEKRAREWTPHQTTNAELLEAIYTREIVLKAIAGSGGRRMAIINGQPMANGDEAKIKAGAKMVSVRCLEVKEKSAVVLIEGVRQPKEISLK